MSDVADRLRKLADAAAQGRSDAAVVARVQLNRFSPELARGYSDALDALAEFTRYDFHATQWLDITHDGYELRAIRAEDVAALIGYVEAARATLAAAARLFPEDEA